MSPPLSCSKNASSDLTGLTHPVDSVFFIAPCMATTLMPFALSLEGMCAWDFVIIILSNWSPSLTSGPLPL